MNTQVRDESLNTGKTGTADLREKILGLVDEFARLTFAETAFEPGESTVPPSGKVIGAAELRNMVDASLDGWLTTGRFNKAFEERFAKFIGVKHALTVNSGSSAVAAGQGPLHHATIPWEKTRGAPTHRKAEM